jgi:hypothetical protein
MGSSCHHQYNVLPVFIYDGIAQHPRIGITYAFFPFYGGASIIPLLFAESERPTTIDPNFGH